MDKEFKKELVKKEDEKSPQYIFISKIRYKEPTSDIEEYYKNNKDNIDLTKHDIDKNLPLQLAVSAKNYEGVQFIINNFANKKKDINLVNSLGWSALHTSCTLPNTEEITTLLINNGADINLENKHKQTPLHLACGKNRTNNIKVLLSYPSIELNSIDYNGFTPLLKACASLSYESALLLISQDNIKLNIRDKIGNTALHYVLEDNKYDVAIKMIQKGADITIQNNNKKACMDLINDNNVKELITSYISKKDNLV